jgi:hypothetical protein
MPAGVGYGSKSRRQLTSSPRNRKGGFRNFGTRGVKGYESPGERAAFDTMKAPGEKNYTNSYSAALGQKRASHLRTRSRTKGR